MNNLLERPEDPRCPKCKGNAKFMVEETDAQGMTDYWWEFCDACNGTGLAESADVD